jgi:GDPmannose 4,6-dehydratase
MNKSAFITGITGQDGALMAEMLLGKGYAVHGLVRRSSLPNTARIGHIKNNPNLHLHYGDVTDATSLLTLVLQIMPQEIYNFAAQSDVHASFAMSGYTFDTNARGTLNILKALHLLPSGSCRFYQASTSEMFGNHGDMQNEQTPFEPCSPYGVSKLSAYWMVVNYRKSHGLFASNGILFNHESAARGDNFVTRKISKAVAGWACGKTDPLLLGNLNAQRDWGHARDYVRGIYSIMQHSVADDFVLATGEMHSVREFAGLAFSHIGREVVWQGSGTDERGTDKKTGETLVTVNPHYFRPVDVYALKGDASKAQRVLGWQPEVPFVELVKEMVDADVAALRKA